MITVLVDTSVIVLCVRYGIDLMAELRRVVDGRCDVCIVDKTLDELKGKRGEGVAREMLERVHARVIATTKDKSVDQLILDHAGSGVVATQDKRLKEKLKKRGVPVLVIRQKSYLMQV